MPRILVVDDDRNIRETLAIHLRNVGYEVAVAADAIEGGYDLLRERPDLIIADVRMPYMDGFEFLAALRADASVADIPVIILSSQDDWQARGRECGANAHLTKPIHLDGLLAAVARELGERALTSCDPSYLRQPTTPDQKFVRLVDVLTDLDL
jgi:chemosensory pili system protein ChpA (sensor histidine kinase/response regulator)